MVRHRERGISGYGMVVCCEQYPSAQRREERIETRCVGHFMITCNATFAPYVLWLITIGTVERVHLHHVVEVSRQISVGATEADVLAILGEPNGRYAEGRGLFGIGSRPRRWMYGTTINLRYLIVPEVPFPSPIPINIRWFGYDEDDLVIDWSRDDKVAKITRPEVHVPEGADELLKPAYFIADVVRFIWSRAREMNGSE